MFFSFIKKIFRFLGKTDGFSLFETFLVLLIAGGIFGGIFSLYRSSKNMVKKQQLKNLWVLSCQQLEDPSVQDYLTEHKEELSEDSGVFNKNFWPITTEGRKPQWNAFEITLEYLDNQCVLMLHIMGNPKKGNLTYDEALFIAREYPGSLTKAGEGQNCEKGNGEPGCLLYFPMGSL